MASSFKRYVELSEAEKAGRWLRKFRMQAGFSQRILVETLGVYRSEVSNWERAVAPVPKKHRKEICRILNCEYDDIWEETE